MNTLIGIVLIIAGAAFGTFGFLKSKKAALEMQYMQTTSIADAIDIVDSMALSDPNYHHYVEVKGQMQSEEAVVAPFSNREVAYYSNACYSVNEEKRVERTNNGGTRTHTVKNETQISSEKSFVPVYIQDQSSSERVYVDMESFGGDADLQQGCDRMESAQSDYARRQFASVGGMFDNGFGSGFPQMGMRGGSRFLGYRLKEDVIFNHQPVYILGELYRNGDKTFIGRSVVSNKVSKFSYKSEDQLVSDTKKQKWISLGIGVVIMLVGVFSMFN